MRDGWQVDAEEVPSERVQIDRGSYCLGGRWTVGEGGAARPVLTWPLSIRRVKPQLGL